MPFKKRASIVDDDDLKDFDSFLAQSESSDEEFSNTRSKAILQQARQQAEIQIQKAEEEKKLHEIVEEDYDSDDLDRRLSKYIGTYELPKKTEDSDSDGEVGNEEAEIGEKDTDDFEDYTQRLGLNLSLRDDNSDVRGSRESNKHKDRDKDSEKKNSLRESLGKWEDNEDEKIKHSEDEREEKYSDDEFEKEANYSDDERNAKQNGSDGDRGPRDENRIGEDDYKETHSTEEPKLDIKQEEMKSPIEAHESGKPLSFAEFQRRRSEMQPRVDTTPEKHTSPRVAQPFLSPAISSPQPDPPPPQPTPRPILTKEFLTPGSPTTFTTPTLSSPSPHQNGPISSPAPRVVMPEPPLSPVGTSLSPLHKPPEHNGSLSHASPKVKSLEDYEREYDENRPVSANKASIPNIVAPQNLHKILQMGDLKPIAPRPTEVEDDKENDILNQSNNNNKIDANQQRKYDELQQQQRIQQENFDRLQQQYREQQQQLKQLQQNKQIMPKNKPSGIKQPAKPLAKKPAQTQNSNYRPYPMVPKPKPAPAPKPAAPAPKPTSNGLPKPAKISNPVVDDKMAHKIIEDSFSKFIQIFQEKAAQATPPHLQTPQQFLPPYQSPQPSHIQPPQVGLADTSFQQYPTYVANDSEWRDREKQLQKEIDELMKENRQLSGSLELKDQRLREKEEEISTLAQSNAALSTRLQTSDMRAKVQVTGIAALTPEEQRQLQQELKELETLVNGYQKENERLCAELKTAQQALKAADLRLLKDKQQMQAEIRTLQDANHYPQSGISDREVAHLREQLISAQRRVTAAEEQARDREIELKDQIEKLRREKRELEAKYSGVDLSQLQKESPAILELENKIKMITAQNKETVEDLQKKIRWYVDNQALLTQNDALLENQKTLIKDLQTKLEQASATQKAQPSRANDVKRIKELEKKIADLESKRGNNIESLISAVHPDNETITSLKNALAAQSAAHSAKETEMDKGFRALRQEHDRMKQQYEKRLKELSAAVPSKAAPKAADVEAQIQAVRNHYQSKLKELQRKINSKPKPPPIPSAPPPAAPSLPSSQETSTHPTQSPSKPPANTSVKPLPNPPSAHHKPATHKASDHSLEERIRRLESDLSSKNEEIRRLYAELSKAQKGDSAPQSEIVFSLQQQLATARLECDSAKLQLHQSEIARTAIMENAASMVKQAQQSATLQQGDLQMAIARAEGEASSLRSRISHLEAELNSYKDTYRDPLPVVEGLKTRIRQLDDEARAMREEMRDGRDESARLRDEINRLKDALTNAHIPPGTAQFRQLESKLLDVESRHKQREADLQSLLEKTKSSASSELATLRAKYASTIQRKNEEINAFRSELDNMLQTISTINKVNSANGVVYFSNVE